MRPVICFITDRRRFGPLWEDALVAQVGAAARAGVHLVQVRERDLDARPLTQVVARCVAAVRGTRARVVVNERLDVALAARAHGVHLRGDSMAASRVRAIAPAPFLIGRSIRTSDAARRAEDDGAVDYVVFGTVFPTESKPDVPAAGVRALAEAVAATRLPVLAVGGVTIARLPDVASAGTAGFAAIGLFTEAPHLLQALVHDACMAFDTPRIVT